MSDIGKIKRIFFSMGLLLFASELWKQCTLTFILNDGIYDFWYFPFQLCSIPMYLLLVFPFWRTILTVKLFLRFLWIIRYCREFLCFSIQAGCNIR